MNTYLAIITTVLVVTQIIRLIQNAVQLHKQNILFKEQLGHLAECNPTEQDFENQRKAYRLIVEYFEAKKIKPPIIREETRSVVECGAVVTLDETLAKCVEDELMHRLGKEVYKFAKIEIKNDPLNYSVSGKATVNVLDKVVKKYGK